MLRYLRLFAESPGWPALNLTTPDKIYWQLNTIKLRKISEFGESWCSALCSKASKENIGTFTKFWLGFPLDFLRSPTQEQPNSSEHSTVSEDGTKISTKCFCHKSVFRWQTSRNLANLTVPEPDSGGSEKTNSFWKLTTLTTYPLSAAIGGFNLHLLYLSYFSIVVLQIYFVPVDLYTAHPMKDTSGRSTSKVVLIFQS